MNTQIERTERKDNNVFENFYIQEIKIIIGAARDNIHINSIINLLDKHPLEEIEKAYKYVINIYDEMDWIQFFIDVKLPIKSNAITEEQAEQALLVYDLYKSINLI